MNIQQLLLLRKVTRAMADALRTQLKDYLSSLAPLIRPKLFFGDFVAGPSRESPNFADKAFQELQTHYQSFALTKPYQCPKDLKTPLDVVSSPLEIAALEYTYEARSETEKKTIAVTAPLKWVLSLPDCSLGRLSELLSEKQPSVDSLQRYCVHYAVLSYVLKRQPGFGRILDALRFPISIQQLPEFGLLPIPVISAPISTIRPPDAVIIENTEISGANAFEEVVNLDDLRGLRDPLGEQLLGIAQGIKPDLLD